MCQNAATHRSDELLGLLAEFDDADALLTAAREATAAGYQDVEIYTPYPMEQLATAMALPPTRLPLLVLVGGVIGACGGFGLQYWAAAIQWPMNIGGRPPNSWPMFVPVMFECTVLVAALFCVFGMLALNGLPRPHHPLFDVEGFERASQDRFFVYLASRDARFDPERTRQFLQQLHPRRVSDVPTTP